ncbi:MAG TPA: hypothetical protein VIV09_03030 [Pseudolabrys sp.]
MPKHRTEPRGVRIPVNLPDEITGQYEGEELREYRSRRDTHVRIERLEDHKDQAIAMFAEVNTKLGMLVTHAEKAETREEAKEKREHEAREADRRRKWILALIAGVAAAVVALIGALR